MRLLTLHDIGDAAFDVEFAPSKWTPLIVSAVAAVVALLALATAVGIIPHGKIDAIFFFFLTLPAALVAMVFAFIFRSMLRWPTWLIRMHGNIIWIRCSSRRGALVVELERSDLAWAQPVKHTDIWIYPRQIGRSRRGRQYTFHRYIDLGLFESASEILERFSNDDSKDRDLRDEIAPPPQVVNQPVRRMAAGVIRLDWSGISRGMNAGCLFLSSWTQLRPLRRERVED